MINPNEFSLFLAQKFWQPSPAATVARTGSIKVHPYPIPDVLPFLSSAEGNTIARGSLPSHCPLQSSCSEGLPALASKHRGEGGESS